MANTKASKDYQEFIADTDVEAIIKRIQERIKDADGKMPFYSDIYSVEEGKTYQYVNYVQEGGGVLGVALVGYTYVLERLGFRFLKLAGTSAGAINTMMLAAVDKKNYANNTFTYKSEIVLQEMLDYNLWNLVDGHWMAKKLIGLFVKKDKTLSRLRKFILVSLVGSLLYAAIQSIHSVYTMPFTYTNWFKIFSNILLVVGGFAFFITAVQWYIEINNKKKKGISGNDADSKKSITQAIKDAPGWHQLLWATTFSLAVWFLVHLFFYKILIGCILPSLSAEVFLIGKTIFNVAGAVCIIGFLLVACSVIYFKGRFARAGFGINPGKNFHTWMTEILHRNKIHNMKELNAVMTESITACDLQLKPDATRPADEANTGMKPPFFSIIASDITLQAKVIFPDNAKHYWEKPEEINPADFVRSSMAIPVFFEPFKVTVPYSVQEVSSLQIRKATVTNRVKKDDKQVCFVDGGILSNFPINVFHNPAIKVARMATFGVKLEDELHEDNPAYKVKKGTLMSFLGQVFSTVRFHYDRDFLKRNSVYEKCIAHVDVENINWLNFGMDYTTQKDLFMRGARAAEIFFCGGTFYNDGKPQPFDGFNWGEFKINRKKMVEEIEERSK